MEEVAIIFIKAAFVLFFAFIFSYLIRKGLSRIKKYNEIKEVDNTQLIFIRNSVNVLIYAIAIFIIARTIPQLKDVGTSLLAGAGILAAIVGFASQAAFSNIVSGVFIVIFKPFRVDDVIAFKDGLTGVVEEITFRHTVIKDFENRRIIIPNNVISNETIINASIEDERVKKHIYFSIAYNAIVEEAITIIQEEIENHPNFIDGREADEQHLPKVPVWMTAWEASSVQLRANAWTQGASAAFILKSDVLMSVKKRFEQAGIEIPYSYLNVIQKSEK